MREDEQYDTSTGATRFKTDATFAYVKAMGNRQGPHALACELVGSSLARWFGLNVPDFAVIDLPSDSCYDLPRGARTQAGPAFLSRHVDGRTWGGSVEELRSLVNPDDITRLVVFDTWVRNCDRHPPDPATRRPNYANVYLAETDRPTRSRLFAIDHTHCFDSGRDLSDRLARIDLLRDEGTYGLFPQFRSLLDVSSLAWSSTMLRSLDRATVERIVASVPEQWEVSQSARDALVEMIVGRAAYVAARIDGGWLSDLPATFEPATDGAP